MENNFINNTILSNDDSLFLKIFLNNIDPLTGEVLNISDDSIMRLKKILGTYYSNENSNQIQTQEVDLDEEIINDFKSGMSLDVLHDKYNMSKSELKWVLSKLGYRQISNTYAATKAYKAKHEKYPNAGKPYKPEEDDLIEFDYINGLSVKELAKKNSRTEGAIKARLRFLGFASRYEDISAKWYHLNKSTVEISYTSLGDIINLRDLEERIDNYLSRRKIEYIKNDKNYIYARDKILYNRFNIHCI